MAIVFVGALLGGFVSGLSGFGTGMTALVFWLFVLSPATAASLVAVCSVAAHIFTLPRIWRSAEARRVLPFVLPGLLGVPPGTLLLTYIDLDMFKLAVGVLLIAFALQAFWMRAGRIGNRGGRLADGIVAFGGGIMGGLSGLAGPLPTMWIAMRGWSKDQARGVIQFFNFSILLTTLAVHAAAGLFTRDLLVATLAALPGTALGVFIGYRVYQRITDHQFTHTILVLLGVSGSFLVLSSL